MISKRPVGLSQDQKAVGLPHGGIRLSHVLGRSDHGAHELDGPGALLLLQLDRRHDSFDRHRLRRLGGSLMINYPLTPAEAKVVRWAGRVITVLAVVTIALLGTIAFAGQ